MDEILTLYQQLYDFLGGRRICEEFCAKILRIIQEIIDNIPPGAKVGLRCADLCLSYLLEHIDFSKTNVTGIYDLMLSQGEFYGYPLRNAEELTIRSCDYVIFATYRYRQAVLQELQSYEGQIIDIYTLLNEYGIELRGPINHYQPGMPLVLNHFYLRYLEAQGFSRKEMELKNFLQAAVEYKDFTMISKVYEEIGRAHV